MNRVDLYKKLSNIHLLYSMPYKEENMRPEHYAIKGYETLVYEQWDEIERLNNIIKYTDSLVDRTIEIIKQQPSEDDTWILERLNGIKQCLNEIELKEGKK